MTRLVRVIPIALPALFLAALAAGCGAGRWALRPQGPKVEVRLPPVEAAELRFREETAAPPPRSAPFSVTDESAGRWLSLFELNISPSDAAGIPKPAGGKAPQRP